MVSLSRRVYNHRMQCNIDAKGKAVRLVIGLITLAAAAILAALILTGVLPGGPVWFAVAGTAAGGAFGVFEAWAGWCAVRAMGFKTRV